MSRARLRNRLHDLWDRWVRGYCCAAPRGNHEDGGYHFWRCNLRRGHDGAHRSLNYLWGLPDGGSVYSPVESPSPRLDRRPVMTHRQRRERAEIEVRP